MSTEKEPNYMTVTELKKQLKQYEPNDLITFICDLYKSSPAVKDAVNARIGDHSFTQSLLVKYKHTMRQMFFQEYLQGYTRLSHIKKLISEFQKNTGDTVATLDLKLHYVECGAEFTNEYGDIDEPFYDSLCSVFGDFVRGLNKLDNIDQYHQLQGRLEAVVEKTHWMGWGFGDYIVSAYHEIIWVETE